MSLGPGSLVLALLSPLPLHKKGKQKLGGQVLFRGHTHTATFPILMDRKLGEFVSQN